MTNRVLVTGGAGFIGSHYVRTLLAAHGVGDVSVTVLDKLTYAGNPANLDAVRGSAGFAFEHGDICDAGSWTGWLRSTTRSSTSRPRPTWTARSPVRARSCRPMSSARRSSSTRPCGTASAPSSTSPRTRCTAPSTTPAPRRTRCTPAPRTSASRAAGDLLVLSYHRTHGVDTRVLRCTNNFGHHQFPEKVIPLFITHLLQGRKAPLYGDGLNVREWLHIDDHVRGIELVRTQGRAGEIYNIGGGTELSNRELTQRLLDACDAGWEMVDFVPDRKGHDRRYSVDFTKIRTELGYRPSKDFDTALAETVAWYHDNRAWWEPLRAHDLADA